MVLYNQFLNRWAAFGDEPKQRHDIEDFAFRQRHRCTIIPSEITHFWKQPGMHIYIRIINNQ